MLTKWAVLSVVLMSVLNLLACSKCRQLADLICQCEGNLMARDLCRRNIDAYSQHIGFTRAVDEQRCEEVLVNPKCNCTAIINHDFEACGMTR